MTSTQPPILGRSPFRPTIGWVRWWIGATILLVLLVCLVVLALRHYLPMRTMALMLAGWLIPFGLLLASLRLRSSAD
jgi:hypothetical protein